MIEQEIEFTGKNVFLFASNQTRNLFLGKYAECRISWNLIVEL